MSQHPRNMSETTPACRMIKLFKQSISPNKKEKTPQVWLLLSVIPALGRRIALSSKPVLAAYRLRPYLKMIKIKFKSVKHPSGYGWQPNSCRPEKHGTRKC